MQRIATPPRTTPTSRLAAYGRARSRIALVALVVLVAWLVAHAMREHASAPTLVDAIGTVLSRRHLRVAGDTVAWLPEDDALGSRGGLVLASADGEEGNDLYYVDVRATESTDGAELTDLSFVTNVSRSGGASEEQLVATRTHAAYVTVHGESTDAVTLVDLRGEPASLTSAWTRVQSLQNAITNLQETGRARGLGWVRYQFVDPVGPVRLELGDDSLIVRGVREGGVPLELVVATADGEVHGGVPEGVEVQALEKGVPGGITWVVDTVRNLSFVGSAPIEWLENKVFALKDWFDRTRYAYVGGDDAAASAAADLGVVGSAEEGPRDVVREQRLAEAEAEIGFPPAPLVPILSDRVEGEGVWNAVVDDPFVNQYPNAPAAFAQTFIRPDAERPYVRVYVTLWDPRQVQLRAMPGTREPETATGQRGTGYIPRDPRTSRFLVGAFDGGFQALHGEFGMMSEGRVYLPPKHWAATVAVFDDGRVGMGSWPGPPRPTRTYDELVATEQIPRDMIDFRQNLTSMVEDLQWNPWDRWWWGAAPPGATEQTFTHRSGLCLTDSGNMAFFWGASLGPEALGAAMVASRCVRAMHLDMNSGHCGFEFYRPYERTAGLATVAIDHDTQFQGPFGGVEGFDVRARKAVRSMAMRFPRYLERDPRDFFYLTLRPTLPGPDTELGHFETRGLPHAGWPYAFARLSHGPSWVVRIDPARAVATPLRTERHVRALASFGPLRPRGSLSLTSHSTGVGRSFAVVPHAHGDDVILFRGEPYAPTDHAALGVDEDGFWVYAEGSDAGDLVRRAGATTAIGLGPSERLSFHVQGGAVDVSGLEPREPASDDVVLYAEEAPAASVLFPDVHPMPYSRWGFLQGQRVRYFRESDAPPRFNAPPEAH